MYLVLQNNKILSKHKKYSSACVEAERLLAVEKKRNIWVGKLYQNTGHIEPLTDFMKVL